MGKTQIALELAYRIDEMRVGSEEKCSVFWMPAQSLAAFQQAVTGVVQKLNLDVGNGDAKEVLREHLASDVANPWVLILDNLDDMSILDGDSEKSKGIRDFLPWSRTGRTLITTRSAQVTTDITGSDAIKLDVMRPDEAHEFLTKGLIKKPEVGDKARTENLLERLAYLPLLIGQAVDYINRSRLPIPAYLQLWNSASESIITLLSKALRDETHHSRTQGAVATTWIVSFEAICKENAEAARILSFIQWIDYKAIPRTILPTSCSEMDLMDSIGTICGYGFLSWRADVKTLDMHRLVHLALRCWLKQKGGLMRKADAGDHLLAIFPSTDWENMPAWRKFLPHTLTLVKEVRLDQHEAMLNLAHNAGLCLQVDGRIREMVQVLQDVVAVREKTLAETHRDRLTSQHALAGVYKANGQVQEAVKLLEHVVAVEEKTLAKTHPYRLASQHALADAYEANGQVQEAVKMLEHVAAVQEKTLAETHPDRLALQHELAHTYEANGNQCSEFLAGTREK